MHICPSAYLFLCTIIQTELLQQRQDKERIKEKASGRARVCACVRMRVCMCICMYVRETYLEPTQLDWRPILKKIDPPSPEILAAIELSDRITGLSFPCLANSRISTYIIYIRLKIIIECSHRS